MNLYKITTCKVNNVSQQTEYRSSYKDSATF